MAPVGQAATHHGSWQWKQGMNTYDMRGKLFSFLGPTGIIWVNLGPIGKLFLVLQCDSQL
jgi:hypothetical protein